MDYYLTEMAGSGSAAKYMYRAKTDSLSSQMRIIMKKLNSWSFLLLILINVFCVTSIQNVFAQNNDQVNKPTLAWINLGFGPVGGNELLGLGLITNAQYNSKYGLFGLRFFQAGSTGMHTGFANYIDDISELSLTYGYSHNFGILNLSASAGIGALWGEERGPGEGDDFSVVSFPIQGSITIQPIPLIGLGGMLSTTVNSHTTISGAHFVLQLGRLR